MFAAREAQHLPGATWHQINKEKAMNSAQTLAQAVQIMMSVPPFGQKSIESKLNEQGSVNTMRRFKSAVAPAPAEFTGSFPAFDEMFDRSVLDG